jgi:Flp pilus assembly pilin Flp
MTSEVSMRYWLRNLWRQDDGQDLTEYALLLAFVLFVTAGVVSIGGQSIQGITSKSNAQISAANAFVPN